MLHHAVSGSSSTSIDLMCLLALTKPSSVHFVAEPGNSKRSTHLELPRGLTTRRVCPAVLMVLYYRARRETHVNTQIDQVGGV